MATDVQKYYNIKGNVKHYKVLEKCKKIFGVKLGWQLWYLTTFVPVYGFECLSLNWVCPRRKIKYRADNREWQVLREIKEKGIDTLLMKNFHNDFVTDLRLVSNWSDIEDYIKNNF